MQRTCCANGCAGSYVGGFRTTARTNTVQKAKCAAEGSADFYHHHLGSFVLSTSRETSQRVCGRGRIGLEDPSNALAATPADKTAGWGPAKPDASVGRTVGPPRGSGKIPPLSAAFCVSLWRASVGDGIADILAQPDAGHGVCQPDGQHQRHHVPGGCVPI